MKKRIISAIVALLICVPIVIYGGTLFYLGVALLGVIGYYELLKARSEKKELPIVVEVIGLISFILVMMNSWNNRLIIGGIDYIIPLTIFMILIPIVFYNSTSKYNVEDALFLLGSIIFLGTTFNILASTRIENIYLFVFLILITIITDTFAYFTGYFIGKHKMCPSVSPNKTWEGFFGGLIMGSFVSSSFYLVAFDYNGSIIKVLIVTIILSIIAQLGDMVFSAIKRQYKIKDFGNIMPGHGGVLDRLDSILFVTIAFHILSRLL